MFNVGINGKTFIITGVANKMSLAAGIARSVHSAGGKVIITVQSQRVADEFAADVVAETEAEVVVMDVTKPEDLEALAAKFEDGSVGGLVHSMAMMNLTDLRGRVTDMSLEGLKSAMDISAHSLIRLVKVLENKFSDDASVVALSYNGGSAFVDGYGPMGSCKSTLECMVRYLASEHGPRGIRVNTISAGPSATRAANALNGFDKLLDAARKTTPLRRETTADDVGGAALFLLSPLAKGVTGTVLFVDSGLNIVNVA